MIHLDVYFNYCLNNLLCSTKAFVVQFRSKIYVMCSVHRQVNWKIIKIHILNFRFMKLYEITWENVYKYIHTYTPPTSFSCFDLIPKSNQIFENHHPTMYITISKEKKSKWEKNELLKFQNWNFRSVIMMHIIKPCTILNHPVHINVWKKRL